MSFEIITFDQAVFTSIRTPMGEGYRIVSASRGLILAEKQAITRHSPSHESLCTAECEASDETSAVSFYALPTGRLCVAHSNTAGAEHTGRGGDRVYTCCVVLTPEDFGRTGYNPFNVIRAMKHAGLTVPQLKPAQVIPQVELSVCADAVARIGSKLAHVLATSYRCAVLEALLADSKVIVDLPVNWSECVETLWLGLPAELRTRIAFSAGLKYSSARPYQLQVLSDEKKQLRGRLSGEPRLFVDPEKDPPPPPSESAWVRFVERKWSRKDFRGLADRTSCLTIELSMETRERLGVLFCTIDDLPQKPPSELLSVAGDALDACPQGIEARFSGEIVEHAGALLGQRVGAMKAAELATFWRPLLAVWRRTAAGTRFAAPLIDRVLRTTVGTQPETAAEMATHLMKDVPSEADRDALATLVDHVLNRFGAWLQGNEKADDPKIEALIGQWQRLRPNCPIVADFPQATSATK